ncbi:unnamed protein product [Calypogeia fissa]
MPRHVPGLTDFASPRIEVLPHTVTQAKACSYPLVVVWVGPCVVCYGLLLQIDGHLPRHGARNSAPGATTNKIVSLLLVRHLNVSIRRRSRREVLVWIFFVNNRRSSYRLLTMGDLRATAMQHGRPEIPADYVDSAPAPVLYTRYANHGPATPAPYDAPPLPTYDPYTPRHFLPPYDPPEPRVYVSPQVGPGMGTASAPGIPPVDPKGAFAPKPTGPPPRQPRDLGPPHDPPVDMVIPGVMHPGGRFEPHPQYAHRAAPGPPLMEPERDGRFEPHPQYAQRTAPGPPLMKPERDGRFEPHPQYAQRAAPGPPLMKPERDGRFEPHPQSAQRAAPGPPLMEPEPEGPSKRTVEVAVPVCCEACKERITNYVGQTPGVDDVECDVQEQKLTVIGDLPPAQVLQRCQKCFRKSTLL